MIVVFAVTFRRRTGEVEVDGFGEKAMKNQLLVHVGKLSSVPHILGVTTTECQGNSRAEFKDEGGESLQGANEDRHIG